MRPLSRTPKIHREPVPAEFVDTGAKLEIVEVNEVDSGRFYVWDYIKRNPPESTPNVYHSEGILYVQYSPSNGALMWEFRPGGRFIPPRMYPKVVTLYPFAVLGSIATLPNAILLPSF